MGLDSNGPWQLRSWLYLYDFNVKVLAHFGQVTSLMRGTAAAGLALVGLVTADAE